MARTYRSTPAPMYVERAKFADNGGGGGEPAEYIKKAEISTNGHSITFTKKDNTTQTFTPGAFSPFPTTAPTFVTNGTTQEFGQSVLNHPSFKAGMAWYGELTCSDLPNGLVNVECTVKALTNYIAVIELSSSNREPYKWEYNTASFNQSGHDAWKLVPCIAAGECPTENNVDYDLIINKNSNGGMKIKSRKSTIKNWRELVLSQSQLVELQNGSEIIMNLSSTYSPTGFKNDYIHCKVNETGEYHGVTKWAQDSFTKIYVDLKSEDWKSAKIRKGLDYIISAFGFDYNYYKTVVLYAGTSDTVEYIASQGMEGNNVVYIQDVSQQKFEHNIDDLPGVKPESRESLEKDIFGLSYVLSIKGSAGSSAAALFAYENTQAAYWDSTSGTVKWADIQAGKVYQVTFDTVHDTLRWLLVMNGTSPVEVTQATKESLLNTGISMAADQYLADILTDSTHKVKGQCFGNGNSDLDLIFSLNDPFQEPTETYYAEFVGRPGGFLLTQYKYGKGGTVHTETEGEYIWTIQIENVTISFSIPANDLNTGIIRVYNPGKTLSYGTQQLFRHTFRITSKSDATFTDGEWKINCTFQAVNAQAGDNTIDYILLSDESYQYPTPDWVLPCSGVIGQVQSGSVSKWYNLFRIKATYTDNTCSVRCLRFEYFDDNMNIQQVDVVTTNNYQKYDGFDFRSEIAKVLVY